MNFGEILSKAWKTIWKHKILWLFGVLAGCGATNGGGNNATVQPPSQPSADNGAAFFGPSAQRAFGDFINFLEAIPIWVWIIAAVVFLLLMVVLSFAFLMIGTFGTAGVIKGTILAEEADPDAKAISFGEIFRGIEPYYWKVFLLNLGLRFAGAILGLFIALPILLLAVCTCFLGLFLLFPIAWFIELMVNFTTIAIIEEDEKIFPAIGRAWQVITRNLGNVLLMFLILGIGQMMAALVITLPLFIAPVPFILNMLVTGFRAATVGLVFSGILFLALIPFVVFLGGVLRAYVLTGWTLTYRRLIQREEMQPTLLSAETDKG